MLPHSKELGAGEIGGRTLMPGLYEWGSNVFISSGFTLSGGPDAVWIFQIAGRPKQANTVRITLTVNGITSHFEGVALSKTLIAEDTGAAINGRFVGTDWCHLADERDNRTDQRDSRKTAPEPAGLLR